MTATFGPAGYGKSQALKAALAKQLADGRRIWVLDPTGTWGHLLRKGPWS
ncbi:hypothetical protein [Streptomyces decoyicus]